MEINKEIEDIAKQFQQECHALVKGLASQVKGPIEPQDGANVFFYQKLAEFEYRLRKLEEKK
jgi:hypothetical protein